MLLTGNSSSWLLLAGIVVMIWVMMRRLDRRKNLSKAGYVAAQHVDSSREAMGKMLGELPYDPSLLEVQLHEVARDLKAEIDTKLRAFQHLNIQAEKQSQRLEAAIHRAEQLGLSDHPTILEEIQRVSSQTVSSGESLAELSLGNLPPVDAGQGPSSSKLSGLQERILDLARRGHGARSIAQQIGVSVGDVELILSLHGGASRSSVVEPK